MQNWRLLSRLNIRDAAAAMGVSAATLSRVERGQPMDGRTLASILKWLLGKERADGK